MSQPTDPTNLTTARGVVPSRRAETDPTGIREVHIEMPEDALVDLRRRLATTRWPTKELVADRSQGVQLATIQALTRYWATEHDTDRRCGHPRHPRQVAARTRVAADHDARLAGIGHRAAGDRRPPDRPDCARRSRR